MARSSAARRPPPVISDEPEGLTFGAMKAAAEMYWPGLGGKVADQWREWNRDLFDGKLRPAPMVLSRMSSVHGHWFPTLDRADQRTAYESQFANMPGFYMAPTPVRFVKRADLLRGMMHRLRTQDGLPLLKGNSQEWCTLIIELHRRLTGERIWASPEYHETTPKQELGKGLFKPEEAHTYQNDDPETGAESLPKDKIAGWPGTVMDLGRITRED